MTTRSNGADLREVSPRRLRELAAGYLQAGGEAEARGDLAGLASAENDLGVVYYLSGRLAEARQALESSLHTSLQIKDPLAQARAAGNLARTEERAGNRKRAFALYQQSADQFHAAGDGESEFLTLRSCSQAYSKSGNFIGGLVLYARALQAKPRRGASEQALLALFRIPLRMMGLPF